MTFFLSSLSLFEIFLFLSAAFSLLKKYKYTTSDSITYSIVLFFSFYSPLIQLIFLLEIINLFILFEIIIVILLIFILIINFSFISSSFRKFLAVIRGHKSLLLFSIIYCYLFLQALFLPPSTWDCQGYHLPRILMMQREGSLFLSNFNTFNQSTFMIGSDILHFLFLRFFSDWFSGIFSFLSYTVIIFGTYSLVKKVYEDEQLSILTTIIIGSLIEIVLQSTSQKNDIHLTAMATASFLSAFNFINRKDLFSLFVLLSCLIFGISVKACFFPFAVPFLFFMFIFHYQEIASVARTSSVTIYNYFNFLIILPILSLVCLLTFLLHNYLNYGHVLGDPTLIEAHKNLDGIWGGVVNLIRYTVQMVNLPTQLGGGVIEKKVNEFLQAYTYTYTGVAPVQPEVLGLSTSIFSFPQEYSSWYGPFGLFIVIPAIFFSLYRGNNFLKFIAASLILYGILICYNVGWVPWYSRLFSLFFGASGLCVAFFLKKSINSRYYNFLAMSSLLVLAYAAFINTDKPLISKHRIGIFLHRNIIQMEIVEKKREELYLQNQYIFFTWFYYVINRDWYYKTYYHDERIRDWKNTLKLHSRLLIIAHRNSWVLPFLLDRPDIDTTLSGSNNLTLNGHKFNIYTPMDLAVLQEKFDYFLFLDLPASPWLKSDRLIMKFDRFVSPEGKSEGETFYLFDYSRSKG